MVRKRPTVKEPKFLSEIHEIRSKMSQMSDGELLKELRSTRKRLPPELRAPILTKTETVE